MKRAVLSLARERSEILFGLDSGKLKAITLAGSPSDDRKVGSCAARASCAALSCACMYWVVRAVLHVWQHGGGREAGSIDGQHLPTCNRLPPLQPVSLQTRNAFKRLQASIVDGRHLPPAEGGPAELQDVMRLILSLAQCSRREVELFRPLLLAACALLPDIAAAAAAPPTPEALAAAAEAQGESVRGQGAHYSRGSRCSVQGTSKQEIASHMNSSVCSSVHGSDRRQLLSLTLQLRTSASDRGGCGASCGKSLSGQTAAARGRSGGATAAVRGQSGLTASGHGSSRIVNGTTGAAGRSGEARQAAGEEAGAAAEAAVGAHQLAGVEAAAGAEAVAAAAGRSSSRKAVATSGTAAAAAGPNETAP